MQQRPVVLLVEDEPLILLHVQLALEDGGFDVITAKNSDMALSEFEGRRDIAVLCTDIGIPGALDGLQLATEAVRLRPDVTVVVTSGSHHADDLTLPAGARFIRKPYTAVQMAALLRKELGVGAG